MDRILVLQGGSSSEREVSLCSAANIVESLQELGYDVVVADPADTDFDLQRASKGCVAVLPILHGLGGEDGSLQAELEHLGVRFLGSGSEACALTFDKAAYRAFMAKHGVLMARGEVVDRVSFAQSALRGAGYVLKPLDGGSSVDTVILQDISREPDTAFFDAVFERHPEMLLEELIHGHELTVGVLGDEALPVILVVPPDGEEFDYDNKYNGQTQELVSPQQIPAETQEQAQDLALSLHRLTGCRHLSRSDMIVTEAGELYVLETNTIPGLTSQSLFPKMAAATGRDMSALVELFVQYATKQ